MTSVSPREVPGVGTYSPAAPNVGFYGEEVGARMGTAKQREDAKAHECQVMVVLTEASSGYGFKDFVPAARAWPVVSETRQVLIYLILFCFVPSYSLVSFPVLFCSALSCPIILFFPVLFCSALSYFLAFCSVLLIISSASCFTGMVQRLRHGAFGGGSEGSLCVLWQLHKARHGIRNLCADSWCWEL